MYSLPNLFEFQKKDSIFLFLRMELAVETKERKISVWLDNTITENKPSWKI
jgi:hypothetical protein